MVRRRATSHRRPGDRRADWLAARLHWLRPPTETTAAAWICRRAAIAMDQLGWVCNPPLSPARPCCRFCRIACCFHTFVICFPCASRNFFLLRPLDAAFLLCPPRPGRPGGGRGAASAAAPQPHRGLAPLDARSLALRGAPSRPAARTGQPLDEGWCKGITHATRGAEQLYLAQACKRRR